MLTMVYVGENFDVLFKLKAIEVAERKSRGAVELLVSLTSPDTLVYRYSGL